MLICLRRPALSWSRHLPNRSVALGFFLLLGPILSPAQTSSITFVQSNVVEPHPSATTVTIPYTSAQSLGNLNIVAVGWNDSTTQLSSVADSVVHSYSVAVGPTVQTGSATQSIYYAGTIASPPPNAKVIPVTSTA